MKREPTVVPLLRPARPAPPVLPALPALPAPPALPASPAPPALPAPPAPPAPVGGGGSARRFHATRRRPVPFATSNRRTCFPASSLIVITSFASPAGSCRRLKVNTAPYGGLGAVQLPAIAPRPAAPAGAWPT